MIFFMARNLFGALVEGKLEKIAVCVLNRPHPDLLPQEKGQPLRVSDFADDRPVNPVTRHFKPAANKPLLR